MSQKPASSDSNDYNHTFYGILNKQGKFWTPRPFDNEEAARAHLSKWAVGDYRSMLSTHKIVPVRVRLETIPASAIEARRAETQSGSVHESAAGEGETPNTSPHDHLIKGPHNV